MERRIREIQEDDALGKIPTRAFAANALFLEVIRLAYNLVTTFQRTCLPEEWQSLTLIFATAAPQSIHFDSFRAPRANVPDGAH